MESRNDHVVSTLRTAQQAAQGFYSFFRVPGANGVGVRSADCRVHTNIKKMRAV